MSAMALGEAAITAIAATAQQRLFRILFLPD
jgi:hypothetical protein